MFIHKSFRKLTVVKFVQLILPWNTELKTILLQKEAAGPIDSFPQHHQVSANSLFLAW